MDFFDLAWLRIQDARAIGGFGGFVGAMILLEMYVPYKNAISASERKKQKIFILALLSMFVLFAAVVIVLT